MSNSESGSMGANDDPRDADELARDADVRRERIGDTLGQLEGKLSPDRLMDNAMGLFKDHGGDLADGLQRSVKNNPLPLLLTGVGIAWMMMNQRETNQRGSSYYGSDPYPSFRQPSYDTRHFDSDDSGSMGSSSSYASSRNIGDDISRASYVDSGRTGEVTSSMEGVDTFGSSALAGEAYIAEVDVDLADDGYASTGRRYGSSQDDSEDNSPGRLAQMREKSGQMGSRMRERSGEMSAQARQRFSSMAGGAGQRADEWSSEASQFMREQPLVAGALGVALGALLGGMLPTSERERQLARQAVDSDAGKRALEQADQAVNSATQEAEKRMDEMGAKAKRKVDEAESEAKADS